MPESPTERAIKAFDAFVQQWTPPAMQPHLFDHDTNAAERVRQAIRGIIDQRRLPLQAAPLGWAVFSQHYDREGIDGFRYDIETAVFPTADQAVNAHKYLVDHAKLVETIPGGSRNQVFVIAEVRRQP